MKSPTLTALSTLIIHQIAFAPLAHAEAVPTKIVQAHYSNWGLEDVKSVWNESTGSKNIVVAIVDTGIDPNHKDLRDNLWKAPGSERATSGSVYGWDFVTNSANPVDTHGHGTHIAGIIGAVANPKMGVAGVAQKVSLMPIRYYSEYSDGATNFKNSLKALEYAINNGAKIINYSGGGADYVEAEFQILKKAEEKGILVVTAAGNDGRDTDIKKNRYFPASYAMHGLKNIISVASIDAAKSLLKSSNFGTQTVDIAAPGNGILSTFPKNGYGKLTGTSQATAFVSGLAALILSENPKLSPDQVKQIILSTATPVPTLKHRVASGGKIDAAKAVRVAKELARTNVTKDTKLFASESASPSRGVAAPLAPKKAVKADSKDSTKAVAFDASF